MRSGMAGQPSQDGKSPLDQERQRGPTKDENTPEAPKPGDGEKEGEQPKPSDQPQDSGQPNPPDGENRGSMPRLDESGAPVTPGIDADRWGHLPERVRRVFKNQITDDLPLQYRDWIDSYYRRMNVNR
jgi:hypothetical protein